jgi:small-conductance mechanosensitive channel
MNEFTAWTEGIADWVGATLGLRPATQSKLLYSVITILVLWLLSVVVKRIILPRIEDIYIRYRVSKITGYVVFALGILIIARIWFQGLQSLVTYLGLLSAGVAIALKEPLTNLAGWIFIIFRRPFDVGDRVQIGDHAGDVIDLRVFQFTLMEIGNWVAAEQSTGRVIHIPNGKVFSEAVANYSKGFHYIWNEIPVLVTFESNWKAAKDILQSIASGHAEELSQAAAERVRRAARKYMIFYTKLTPTVYTSVVDSGVLLTIRYLCEPRKRRGTEESIWEDILSAFSERKDIDFAYPTRRYYNNLYEGKEGSRAPAPGPTLSPGPEGPAEV